MVAAAVAISFIPVALPTGLHSPRPPKPPRYAMASPKDNNNKNKKARQPLSPTAPAFSFTTPQPDASNAETSGPRLPSEANQSPSPPSATTASAGLLSAQANEQIFEGVTSPKSPRGRLQRNGGRSAPATPSEEGVLSPTSLGDEPRMDEVARYNKLKTATDEEREKAYDQSLTLQTERDEAREKLQAAESAKAALEKDIKNKTTDADNATKDNERLEKELKAKDDEKAAKEKEVQDWKQKFEDMKTLYASAESNRDDFAVQLTKAEQERDHQTALKEGLKEELEKHDAAVEEVNKAVEQQVGAQEQLDKVMRVFRDEFKQLSEGVDIDGYLKQFRETVQAGRRLRRDDSQSSFHHQGLDEPLGSGRSRAGNRQVSTASLGDELKGHESESGEDTGDEGEEGDEAAAGDDDPTLREIDTSYIQLTPPTTNNWTAGTITSNVEDSLFGEVDTGTQTPAHWSHRPTGQGLGLNLHINGEGNRTSMAHGLDWGPGDKGVSTDEIIPTPAELANLRAQAAAAADLKAALSNAQGLAATRQQEKEKQFKLAQDYAKELKAYKERDDSLSPAQRDGFEPWRGRARTQQQPKKKSEEEESKKPVTAERDYGPFSDLSPLRVETKTVYVPTEPVIKTEYRDRIIRKEIIRLPESRAEWLKVTPTWMLVLAFGLLVLFMGLWVQLVRDRAVWFSVNDLGQQDLIKLTSGARYGATFWQEVAEWVGGDLSLVG